MKILTKIIASTIGTVMAFAISAAHAAPVKMAIATGVDPSFAAFYLGKTQGIFEKNGLDVEVRTGPSGSAMVAYVVKNQIQSAFGAEQAGIQNFNIDPNVVLIGEGTAMREFYGLVARNVPDMEALKGKKIGVARGSASEVFWNAMVKALNLNRDDYKIVQVEPPEMVAALHRGDIDAFTSWEPWLYRATSVVPDTTVLRGQEGIMNPSVFIYINKGWAVNNPDAAGKFVKSLIEANQFISEQPDAAADQVSAYLKLDRDVTGMLMAKYSYNLRMVQNTVDQFVAVADQLQESGKLTKSVNWEEFLYADLLRKVDPSKVEYKIPAKNN